MRIASGVLLLDSLKFDGEMDEAADIRNDGGDHFRCSFFRPRDVGVSSMMRAYLLPALNSYHGALMSAASSRSRMRQSMSATEVFDYRGTLERLGGDTGLFADLVRFFLEDTGEILQRAHDAAKERDTVKLSRAAHSLKGLCSNFGGREAVDLAWRIEQSAMLGDADNAPVAELEAAVARLSDALRKQLESAG